MSNTFLEEGESGLNIPVKGGLRTERMRGAAQEILSIDYPPHSRGVDQVYTRVDDDESYVHELIDVMADA